MRSLLQASHAVTHQQSSILPLGSWRCLKQDKKSIQQQQHHHPPETERRETAGSIRTDKEHFATIEP